MTRRAPARCLEFLALPFMAIEVTLTSAAARLRGDDPMDWPEDGVPFQ